MADKEKIFLHSFGCKVNQYEGQVLREKFAGQGREFTDRLEDAGMLLIQSCTVTAEADRQCRQLIRQALRKNPGVRVFVSGCYAVRAPRELADVSPSVSVLENEGIMPADNSGITRFENHSRAFVKIQDGCDAFCSYCIVPYVRGKMASRPEKDVLCEIKNLVGKGYPEIVLTGVRLGKYEGGLKDLLEKILKLEGEFRVRLSSLELGEVSEGLLSLMKSRPERICSHLHLPLQSGSDGILGKMRRPYTAGEFAKKILSIKKLLPDAGITTDIIAGFPGETDRDFKDTYDLAKDLELSRLHVFRYSRRDGTLASRFRDIVHPEKVKARSAALRELDKKLQALFWNRFIGTVRTAVLEGTKNTLLTDNYIRLNIKQGTHSNYNKIINAKITSNRGRPWGELIEL